MFINDKQFENRKRVLFPVELEFIRALNESCQDALKGFGVIR